MIIYITVYDRGSAHGRFGWDYVQSRGWALHEYDFTQCPTRAENRKMLGYGGGRLLEGGRFDGRTGKSQLVRRFISPKVH